MGQKAPDVTVRSRAVNNFAQICVTVHTWLVASAPPNLQRCPCARHPLCVLPCSCPLILGRSIGHRVRPVSHRPRGKCALCATTRRRVKGRRRRMRRPPCFLVRHECLELRRLMPTGWSCQVGAGLLGLITSTFFPPFLSFFFKFHPLVALAFLSFFLGFRRPNQSLVLFVCLFVWVSKTHPITGLSGWRTPD